MQRAAAVVIANMCMCDATRDEVGASPLLTDMITALAAAQNPTLQSSLLRGVASLARSQPNRVRLMDAGAVDVVLQHARKRGVYGKQHVQCAGALANISLHQPAALRILAAGGVPILLSMLDETAMPDAARCDWRRPIWPRTRRPARPGCGAWTADRLTRLMDTAGDKVA